MLLYHRVASARPDPWNLCVEPERLAAQLEILQRHGLQVVPLRELVAALEAGEVPARRVAITFDDGYADNYTAARPLLARFSAPATFFITTGSIGARSEFWWDTIERLILGPGRLPSTLALGSPGGAEVTCKLGVDATWTPAQADFWAGWTTEQPAPTARHRAHQRVWQLLFQAKPSSRAALLRTLEGVAEDVREARATHRTMTATELAEFAQDHLVEIGAHSVSHAPLSALSTAEQADELSGSRTTLETIIGQPVTGCSYPHGDCSRTTLEMARAAGFSYACGSEQRAVRRGWERYRLPRVSVPNWSGADFERMLGRFFTLQQASANRRPAGPPK